MLWHFDGTREGSLQPHLPFEVWPGAFVTENACMIMCYTRSRSALRLSVRDKVAAHDLRCSNESIKDKVEEILVVESIRIIPKVLRLGTHRGKASACEPSPA